MICVPLLSKVLKFDSKVAHASAIAIIFPISFVSACVYSANANIEFFSLMSVSLGVVVGGIFGAFLLEFLPEKIVRIVFVFVMLFGGIKLIFWFRKWFFEVLWYIFCLLLLVLLVEFLVEWEWEEEHFSFLFFPFFLVFNKKFVKKQIWFLFWLWQLFLLLFTIKMAIFAQKMSSQLLFLV